MNSPGLTGSAILPQQPDSVVEASGPCAVLPSFESSSSPEITDSPQSLQSNYETLFNLAPVGYLIVYEDMVIREVNRAAASLLGIPRLELLGNPLILYAQTQFRESLRTHFRRVLSGHEESIELSFDHPGGPVRTQLHSARIQEPATERPCCLCSLIDLSGQQNSQDELVRYQARLKALQIEQTKRTADLQDRLLEESTSRRKAQQEARLHSQAVQERSEELDRLRRDLADQTSKQQQTEQHLARLQQHLTRLTQGLAEPSAPLAEPKSSAVQAIEELPSPEQLHQLHHRLLSRIEKLDAGLRNRQSVAEPKIRLVLRLLAQLDRLRSMRINPPERTHAQSLEQSLRITETLLQKTCHLNSIAAWQYDPACGQWVTCTGLALLMGIRKESIEPDPAAFCTSIVPEDRQTLQQVLQSPPTDPPIRIVDIRLVQGNGVVRHFRHTLETLLQPDKTVRLSAAVIDITAWKKSEFHKTRCLQRLGRLGRDQIVGLSAQRDQLLLEQSSLHTQLEDLRRQRGVLENRIEALQAGLGELRQKHGAERERNRHLVAQFRKHKDRLTQLVGERTRQIEDIRQSVNARHKALQSQIADLSVQLRESQSVCDQRRMQLEDLQQRNASRHAELRQTIEQLTEQRDGFRQQLDQLSSVESQARELGVVRDHLIGELNQVRKELEDQTRTACAESNALRSQLRTREEQSAQSNAEWRDRVQSLENRLASAIQQQQAAQLQVLKNRESFETRIRDLTEALACAQQDLNLSQKQNTQAQTESLQERRGLQTALSDAESKAGRLEKTLEQLRSQHESVIAHASEQIEGLKTELTQARQELLSSQSECRRLAAESQTARIEGLRNTQQLQHDLDLTHKTVARLQEQLRSQQQQIEQTAQNLHSDLDNLRCRLAESQSDFEAFLHMVRDDIQCLLGRFQTTTDNDELPNLAAQIAELADIAHLLIATGRINELKNVDPQSLVEGIVDSFHDWIDQAGVQVELGRMPECRADANLLTRVFVELIDNALKFLAADRPGHIRIDAWTQDRLWLCQIEDNGIGMPPHQIDRAFELGVQLTPGVPGRGLGLAFVRRIVNLHHGRIEVDSQPGQGTRILLALPLD